jgi:hypothetical protein
MDYRHQAQQHLQNATDELGTNLDQRLRYAALELRMAMECLTYSRALAYKDEFPPEEYETWQPRKVMSVLLEIDPMADKDCSLAMGVEEVPGVPAPIMQSLGTEKILSMSMIREHYDALGSYLHVQSMKQARAGVPLDFKKIRTRCDAIAACVDQVLASPIFNLTIGNFSTIECVECGKPIRKRLPHSEAEVKAECYGCKATYTIADGEGGQVMWKPHQHEIRCANPKCEEKIVIWYHELEIGRGWKCKGCGGDNVFVHATKHIPSK